MLSVINLRKKQGDFELKNVTFQVNDGEYFVILGPSGSGKTTLLDCIAGLRRVDEGRIIINDVDVTHYPPELRNIGYVFQTSTLFPHMTVYENIEYPLKLRGVPKEERRRLIIEISEKMGIRRILNKMPNEISGGEARRAELARALIIRPNVLLLDEPLSHLDEPIKKSLRMELRRIKKDYDIPIIHVTHDQREAFILSDKIALIRNGEIVEIGDSFSLFLNPRKTYTAEFLGFENIFQGIAGISGDGSIVNVEGVKFFVTESVSGTVKIGFRPEDVIIFKEYLGRSSIRNIFTGNVVDLIIQGATVMLDIDVGIRIKALITRRSLEELDIKLGDKVIIGIKSTAIKIFTD